MSGWVPRAGGDPLPVPFPGTALDRARPSPVSEGFSEGDRGALPPPCHGVQTHRALSSPVYVSTLAALSCKAQGRARDCPGQGVGDMLTVAQVTA